MRFSTRLILASLLGLAGLSTNVDAHAKLVSPTAWNPQPSKSNTCGVAANANAANPQSFKKTVLGNTVDIQWTVVIGDGNGPITAKLDTTAKVNPTAADFTVNLAATNDFPNQQKTVGPYTVRFTIPSNIKCTGPDNTCTMRVASSSNWVACATIQLQSQQQVVTQPPVTQAPVVTQAPTTKAPTTKAPTQATPTNSGTTTQSPVVTQPPATDPPATEPPATQPPATSLPTRDPTEYYPYASSLNTCQVASGLTTCKNINGQSVQLMGINLAAVEAQAIEQIEFDFNNPAVLERPNTVGCREALTDLICAQMFPPCLSDATVVCTSTCQRVNNLCKPNATAIIDDTGATSTHAQLFDCTNTKLGFTANDADSNGNCPSVTTGVRPTTAPGTTQKPVSLSSTGRNHASSLQSSFTVVMGVVTVLLAFVARV